MEMIRLFNLILETVNPKLLLYGLKRGTLTGTLFQELRDFTTKYCWYLYGYFNIQDYPFYQIFFGVSIPVISKLISVAVPHLVEFFSKEIPNISF